MTSFPSKATCTTIMRIFADRRILLVSYFCFALVSGLFAILLTPPFQVADEANHFMRAMQIANGGLVGIRRTPMESGAILPEAVALFSVSFDQLKGAPAQHVTPDMIRQAIMAGQNSTQNSTTIFVGISNTVIYPPTSYFGAVAGIVWARLLNSSLLGTFYLARTGSLIVNIVISTAALALMPDAGIFLLAILALPMSISLMASCSQDGSILALSALAIACTVHLTKERTDGRRYALALGAGIAYGCVAAAKAPYLLIAFAPVLLINKENIRFVITSCCTAMILFLVWTMVGLRPVMTKLAPAGASASAQLSLVLHHPFWLVRATTTTLMDNWRDLLHQVIGVLGWLDLNFSATTYRISYGFLLVSFALSCLLVRNTPPRDRRILRVCGQLAVMVAAASGIFAALYITWTPVGRVIIDGVQGRYFLPIGMLAAMFPFLWNRHEVERFSTRISVHDIAVRCVGFGVSGAYCLFCYFTLCEALSNRYW